MLILTLDRKICLWQQLIWEERRVAVGEREEIVAPQFLDRLSNDSKVLDDKSKCFQSSRSNSNTRIFDETCKKRSQLSDDLS